MSTAGDCVVITFLSFRASEARHGIQYYQHVLDAGFHRHDDVDGFFTIATQPPKGNIRGSYLPDRILCGSPVPENKIKARSAPLRVLRRRRWPALACRRWMIRSLEG